MRRVWAALGTLVLLAVAVRVGAPRVMRAYWQRQESNAVLRGAAIATRAGCFACHGPQGTRGLPDPGSGQTVPIWDGGVPMMYVNGEEEVREYILDGVSKRRAVSVSAAAEREKAAIRMPAYREALRSEEVEDLVRYFMAVSDMAPIDDPQAARGRDLVRRHRCEACHGTAGSGGVLNPGSLKGYVPGWLGDDYTDLVRDDRELHQWILEGGIERLTRARLARYFLTRQRLQMPAYKAALAPGDGDAIGAYIRWLRSRP
jgi:mono/diheme cytochrome c family protein